MTLLSINKLEDKMNRKSLSIIRQRVGLALSAALPPVLLLLTASAVFVQINEADASSHREAPLISKDAYADNTDTYAFISPENPDNIVLAASWIPFEVPEGGPNYFEWDDNVFYEINVDNNGDAVADFNLYAAKQDRKCKSRYLSLQYGTNWCEWRKLEPPTTLHRDRNKHKWIKEACLECAIATSQHWQQIYARL